MDEIITPNTNGQTVSSDTAERDMTPLFADKKYSTRLLIVRHGESLANAKGIFLGHTDLGLSERGFLQAAATAEYLKDEPISAAYSSDLCRAFDTAKEIARYHSLEVTPMRELREIYIGKWENSVIAEIERDYGEIFTVGWKKNFGFFTPPIPDAAKRFHDAVLTIAKRHEGECVLIGAHAAVIRAFFGRLLDIAPERVTAEIDFPYNASVSTVYFDGEKLVAGEFSHSAHLLGI